jgi:hypothetical protein
MGGGGSRPSSAELTVDEKRRLTASLSGKYEAAVRDGNDDKELFQSLSEAYNQGTGNKNYLVLSILILSREYQLI